MSVRRGLFSLFMTLLSCICFTTAWAQDIRQVETKPDEAEIPEIPLVSSKGGNLVLDSDWYIAGTTAEVVQEGANTGRYCLHIATTKREDFWKEELGHSGHFLRKDKAYTVAAYLRSPDKLQIRLALRMVRGNLRTGYGEQLFTMTDTWQEYHVTTPPMPEDVSPAQLRFQFAYDTGEFYIDSVRLYQGEYVPYKPESVGHIEGRLIMLDGETPHVAVPVQAIRNGKAIATTLTDGAGRYKLINLRPESYQVRCQVLSGYVYYVENGNGRKWEYEEFEKAATSSYGDFLQVERGGTLQDINFRFAPFKKGNWRNYTYTDGLADPIISSICCFSNGEVWISTGNSLTGGSGIFRYDGKGFTRLTKEDGLADNYVTAVHPDPDGGVWLGTANGVSLYDGKEFTNFTEKDGLVNNTVNAIDSDHDGNIWFGTASGVSRYDGKEFVNFTAEDGLVYNQLSSICCDLDGDIWLGTDGGVSRYDGRGFVNFTAKDGLANNNVNAISCDLDGILWFGTEGGVSRYDGKEFVNLTNRDGLIHNNVKAIRCAPDGVLWFGAYAGDFSVASAGVSRYDGKTFVNFTTEDGLMYNSVTNIQIGADGSIWFGTYGGFGGGGVSRYDEKTFANFTMEDGLLHNRVFNIHLAEDGMLWVGTQDGVSRYDGKQFFSFPKPRAQIKNIGSDSDGTIWLGTELGGFRYNGTEFVHFMDGNVTIIHRDPDDIMWVGLWGDGVYRYKGEESIHFIQEDGLANNWIIMGDPIDSDPDGTVWIGTWTGGVSRYDGAKFLEPLTEEDGLADNRVTSVCCTDDGVVWFGTWNGVSRYDGRGFVNFTYGDGLAGIMAYDIYSDPDGITWFGGYGGISLYDGNAWSSLDMRDGLAGGEVWSIELDPEGFLWFGTGDGLTRYKRNTTPPWVHIVSVTTDQTYTDISNIPAFNTGTRVTVEYDSIDLKTISDKRQYQCRIKGIDTDWRKPTKSTLFNYIFKKAGSYTFEVQVIDRDLIYSEPASLKLVVVLPFYMKASFLVPTIGSAVILLLITIASATAYIRHRKQVHAYQQAAVQELRDAHEMQMALLPEAAPPIEGMEIAGRSIAANTVGGDFFDYLELPDGRIGIAIADVSGKGLRAAMNATMANGMMHEVATIEASCGRILSRLNAHLYPLMEKQMFTAFSLAILDQDAGVIQWSNAGQPLPMIKRSDGVSEAEGDGELPLGMAPHVTYPDHELKLQTGDIVTFYTDGIIEAENEAEEMYGTERLERALSGIDSALSSNEIIEAILKDVTDFTGSAEQYDDMTIVVTRKL